MLLVLHHSSLGWRDFQEGRTERTQRYSEFDQFKSWTQGPSDFSCQALAEGLKENSTLINLNLLKNGIDSEAAKARCLVRMVWSGKGPHDFIERIKTCGHLKAKCSFFDLT